MKYSETFLQRGYSKEERTGTLHLQDKSPKENTKIQGKAYHCILLLQGQRD